MSKQPEKEKVVEMSEDVLGHKLDYCLADSVIKIASGAAIGTVLSLGLSGAKKTWPIWLGTGIGIGMGWSNCKHEMQNRNWHCTVTKNLDNNSTKLECKSSSTSFFSVSKPSKTEASIKQEKETKP
ncbi:hypothetical protein ACQ4LE_008278 [Meloidogyne hapla]|uniref:MICOS complex subunit MIC10 n=1 Tax=Meloidogyne hapla TaxID=6305 RepID=A0A1I8BJJ5_MELHA